MIGTTLGHYKLVAKLGHGGMGEVFRAQDTKLKRDVALKVLPSDLAGDDERLQRFQREAESIAALNHPNIVTTFSVEEKGFADAPIARSLRYTESVTLAQGPTDGSFTRMNGSNALIRHGEQFCGRTARKFDCSYGTTSTIVI